MKLLLLLSALVALLTGVRVLCQEPEPKEDADYWTSTNHIQDGWLSSEPLREMLLRMTRKPRPHQFIGLMGRRSTGHKVNSFVGLMGKRSQEDPESYEWSTIRTYDQRR
ncbi:protachykinin-1 isoform X2 [Oryzias melastigma]|uniref:Tachykinin precursor 1 n=1 Tax=Oryzias melastigma TaxID=30732 RepID=A0A3B3D8X2_ORYME|nr:protachykinin-1 isoform X2 [Oryzias melastigma]